MSRKITSKRRVRRVRFANVDADYRPRPPSILVDERVGRQAASNRPTEPTSMALLTWSERVPNRERERHGERRD